MIFWNRSVFFFHKISCKEDKFQWCNKIILTLKNSFLKTWKLKTWKLEIRINSMKKKIFANSCLVWQCFYVIREKSFIFFFASAISSVFYTNLKCLLIWSLYVIFEKKKFPCLILNLYCYPKHLKSLSGFFILNNLQWNSRILWLVNNTCSWIIQALFLIRKTGKELLKEIFTMLFIW